MNKPARILIAEDDENYAQQLVELFQGEGYATVLAHDGREALNYIHDNSIDMGFIDLQMPGVNGIDVIEQSAKDSPDIPLVMITGYANIDRAVKATRSGAYDFIEKPASLDRLLLTAERALEKRHLEQKNRMLSQEIQSRFHMVGTSNAMQSIYQFIDRVSSSTSTVLITGESGTGKELVAHALHRSSSRSEGPYIKVNCAAIAETLIESELFGHKKGSFTDATSDKVGKFIQANNGTILLDEIGDMSENAQAKILRVLQEGEVQAIGDTKIQKSNARVIAATNQNLGQRIKENKFREDLYYRLSILDIDIPPLRDRKEDIPELAQFFLTHTCDEQNKLVYKFEQQAMQLLINYDWPGNIRQLKAIIERLCIFADDSLVGVQDVKEQLFSDSDDDSDLNYRKAMEKFERQYIRELLIANEWSMNKTAQAMGIDRTNLYKKMQKLDISKEG